MTENVLRLLLMRLAASVLVLFVVLTMVFFMSRAIGDPASLLADIEATAEGLSSGFVRTVCSVEGSEISIMAKPWFRLMATR